MATWKERGVVPDSDDEDTIHSGDEISYYGRNNDELDENDINDICDPGKYGRNNKEITETTVKIGETLNFFRPEEDGLLPQESPASIPSPRVTEHAPAFTLSDLPDTNAVNVCLPETSRETSNPLDARRDETGQITNAISTKIPKSAEGPSLIDDISKSYVLVGSSMSSSLSSLPNTQSTISEDIETPNSRLGPLPQAFPEQTNEYRRALRQRNPNQLKPYTVEQVKYRAVMKARGMAPTRIELTPNETGDRGGAMHLSESESQEFYSQGMDPETQDSQQENDPTSSLPASPKQRFYKKHQKNTSDPFGSDDDLPDIDELLLHRDFLPKSIKSTRPKQTYSGKPRFIKHRGINVKPQQQERRYNKDKSDFWDVPASPPITSPLLGGIDETLPKSRTRTSSFSSQELATSSLHVDELGFNFPTPATSAAKQAPIPMHIDSDTDSDDPFASQLGSDVSPKSSSDESIQIRRVGKKIRGVLPASHLRLNQISNRVNIPARNERVRISASPDKQSFRRGVAIPQILKARDQSPTSADTRSPVFSDDSDESEAEPQYDGVLGDDSYAGPDPNLEPPRTGLAEEEDRVDAMLPAHKRQWAGHTTGPRKKKRLESSRTGSTRQANITDHLIRSRKSSLLKPGGNHGRNKLKSRRPSGNIIRLANPAPPKLSILDVNDSANQSNQSIPLFIKVAARTARTRRDRGRQSPSRKFIKLATREDTVDAQSLLQDWKDGKIKPKSLDSQSHGALEMERSRQSRLSSPKHKARSQAPLSGTGRSAAPRRLLISKDRQQSINEFIALKDSNHEAPRILPQTLSRWDTVIKKKDTGLSVAPPSRPAQLETSEFTCSNRYPTTAFKRTKKTLDSFYKATQKQRSNVQINRFLAAEDSIKPCSEVAITSQPVKEPLSNCTTVPRGRKRIPLRLDVGASVFRQSSEPLLLDYIVPVGQDTTGQCGKLTGLGKFGTVYPIHFDILPLQSGVHFHRATFIGSGHLRMSAPDVDVIKPPLCFHLGEREFRWGMWNENVSSDVGVCFDWIFDQLNQRSTDLGMTSQDNPASVVTCIIDYVQNHMSVTSPQSHVDFLSRMVEIMGDFASRLEARTDNIEELQPYFKCSVTSRCTVLALQILRISQKETAQGAISSKLETILVKFAQICINLLLHQGLDELRALYEKLQYLSFRESGIFDTYFLAEAWVVIIRTLGAAKIPRYSFWDVTNKLVLNSEILDLSDARDMEKLWYSVFSLLPLCEFDDTGAVIQGARHSACFDNWALPQRMLKSVFALYSSNARQSPGFNDYCKTIVSRCHVLMLDWGWWKAGIIIGTLFDFFASQNLAHLRNEEVHSSPRFLDELNMEPSLNVEPEDRCFHVFLKLIALEIQHLRKNDEEKGIRNLVTRLLPNHNRQYPKEETILERELAALRNHHDLLATLYWAAPANQRPSPIHIQNLVEPDRSHNAACLINLRAWKQLAVFLLASPTPSNAFDPFISWQNTFFDKLLEQYIQEEVNTRKQAEGPAGDSIPETFLQQQITSNRASTMRMLYQIMANMMDAVSAARNISGLEAALNKDVLGQLFNNDIVLQDEGIIVGITKVVHCYIDKINILHPYEISAAYNAEDESQDSIGNDLRNWERNRLASYLLDNSASGLCYLVRMVLDCAERIKGISVVNNLISCWASYVCIGSEEHSKLSLFLPGGPFFVFNNRDYHAKSDYYWSLFLCELLARKPFADLEAVGFDIGLEWLRILVLPSSFSQSTLALSQRMAKAHHPFVSLEHGTTLRNFYERQSGLEYTDWPSILIKDGISRMVASLQELEAGTEAFRNQKEQYSSHLKLIMSTMEHQLRKLVPSSSQYKVYMSFVQQVATHICSHADHIQPLTLFLRGETDRNYIPRGLYLADLSKYVRRLSQQPERTSSELFYFLFESFKRDTADGHLKDHIRNFKQALENWEFTKYVLQTYIPTVVTSSWETRGGWMLAGTYLPPLASHIATLLSMRNAISVAAYSHTVALLKLMANNISNARVEEGDDRILTVHPQNRGIVAITYEFWLSVYPAFKSYCEDFPINFQVPARDPFLQLKFSFEKFEEAVIDLFKARITFGFRWDVVQPKLRLQRWDLDVTFNNSVRTFATFLTQDINGWENVNNMPPAMLFRNGWICNKAKIRGGSTTKLALRDFWGSTLRDLLFKSSSIYNPVEPRLDPSLPTHKVVNEVKDMTVKAVEWWQAFNHLETEWMRKIRDPKDIKYQDKD